MTKHTTRRDQEGLGLDDQTSQEILDTASHMVELSEQLTGDFSRHGLDESEESLDVAASEAMSACRHLLLVARATYGQQGGYDV